MSFFYNQMLYRIIYILKVCLFIEHHFTNCIKSACNRLVSLKSCTFLNSFRFLAISKNVEDLNKLFRLLINIKDSKRNKYSSCCIPEVILNF